MVVKKMTPDKKKFLKEVSLESSKALSHDILVINGGAVSLVVGMLAAQPQALLGGSSKCWILSSLASFSFGLILSILSLYSSIKSAKIRLSNDDKKSKWDYCTSVSSFLTIICSVFGIILLLYAVIKYSGEFIQK